MVIQDTKMSKVKWNSLDIFLHHAYETHQDKFDYSQIADEDINGCDSRIDIQCNTCFESWETSIFSHINGKTGCPHCFGKRKMTYRSFMLKVNHLVDKFDYSLVKPENFGTSGAIITHICRNCGVKKTQKASYHINIPSCRCHSQLWHDNKDLLDYITETNQGYSYSYNLTDLWKMNLPITVTCLHCDHSWKTTPKTVEDSVCRQCDLMAQKYDALLCKAANIHGNKFDYSLITPRQCLSNKSKIDIICNTCNKQWTTSITCHINLKAGCRHCTFHEPWNLDRFMSTVTKIHTNYDFSAVTSKHITGAHAKVPVTCKNCKSFWTPTVSKLINAKQGCPICRSSHGEKLLKHLLEQMEVEFCRQYIIPRLPRKMFDFWFKYQDKEYLIEYDGLQHFQRSPFFHKQEGDFEQLQANDINKASVAIDSGYHLIRIPYTYENEDKIKEIIDYALQTDGPTFADTDMYTNMIASLGLTIM